ncbi:GNAT family N-acetyltransferase [Marinomonas sp. THO17]|uniref:GNAT family N-acetyltransferase n=1 Tax=Marinomonas sp. THO17 TaxID=3149048 RepID=UPI00336BD955
MPNETSKRLETYELTIRDMTHEDVDKLHELSITVHWPHRPHDWQMLLSLGKGVVGCDPIGRIVASGMWFPIAEKFATIGMVITSPRLQMLGGGRWIMKHVMAQCAEHNIILNATKAGHRLYQSLGFHDVAKVSQHQGIATSISPSLFPVEGNIRLLESPHIADIIALDGQAFGTVREQVMQTLLANSTGSVLMRNDKVAGFALCRKFGRGHVIGPVVAATPQDAIALVTPHVNDHAGQFLRLDTCHQDAFFKDFLSICGLPEFDQVTTMKNSAFDMTKTDLQSFALASQALG